MVEKVAIGVFAMLLFGAAGYVFLVQPTRARRAMAALNAQGFASTNVDDVATLADIRALLPLPNDRIFLASEKTQGPFTLRNVWTSRASLSYFAYLTRWQRSPQYNVEQGARRNEELSQTCYFEHAPRAGQSVIFVGYGVQSRGVVNLEDYHGVSEVHDGLDAAFANQFSVFALRGETARVPDAVQAVLLTHAEYFKSAPYASLKFSAEGWGICRYRITDADKFMTFKAVCDDITAAFR